MASVDESKWIPARLISVAGIRGDREAEQRATSAFLAVLSVVRDLSSELLAPMGASSAAKAKVETFTEATVDSGGRSVRPDGVIRVTYGKRSWTALVEVKTGDNKLDKDQVNSYWQAARQARFDHIITISNEIAASGAHPVDGLRVQSNSPVQVSHLSWVRILATALRLKNYTGVEDPEQAWILGELVRYLQHEASGVLPPADMGGQWPAIRDAARAGTLSTRTPGLTEVAGKIDEMHTYAALTLSSEIGEDVEVVLSRPLRSRSARIEAYRKAMIQGNAVVGTLRIPHTAGDIRTEVDLRAQQLQASVAVRAPEDKGSKGRVGWILSQLSDVDSSLVIESYTRNARVPISATLSQVQANRSVLLAPDRAEANRFVLVQRIPMPHGRRASARTPGFLDGYMALVTGFYESVVQGLTPWQPSAPKRRVAEPEEAADREQDSDLSWDWSRGDE